VTSLQLFLHFVLSIRFASLLPLVDINFYADQREDHTKSNTRHEVTAARAGRFCF